MTDFNYMALTFLSYKHSWVAFHFQNWQRNRMSLISLACKMRPLHS